MILSFSPFYKKFVPIQKIGPDGDVIKEMVEVPEEYQLMASDVKAPVHRMIQYQCKDSKFKKNTVQLLNLFLSW